MKCELIHDHFQNFRSYGLPKAQLIIADIPYNISADFYASRPSWWKDGKIENGARNVAGKAAFNSDCAFNLAEYFHFYQPSTDTIHMPPKGDFFNTLSVERVVLL